MKMYHSHHSYWDITTNVLSSNTFPNNPYLCWSNSLWRKVSCLHGLRCTRFATTERLGFLSALFDINIAMPETNIMAKYMGPYSHVIQRYTSIWCVLNSQVRIIHAGQCKRCTNITAHYPVKRLFMAQLFGCYN